MVYCHQTKINKITNLGKHPILLIEGTIGTNKNFMCTVNMNPIKSQFFPFLGKEGWPWVGTGLGGVG